MAVRRWFFTRRNVVAGLSKQYMIIDNVTGARGKETPTKTSSNPPFVRLPGYILSLFVRLPGCTIIKLPGCILKVQHVELSK